MKNKVEFPVIEKGIPIPDIKLRDSRNTPRSPWPDWLKKLEVGDSFVLFYPAVSNVMSMAKFMGIPLIKVALPKSPGDRMAKVRIWRVKYEHDYSI